MLEVIMALSLSSPVFSPNGSILTLTANPGSNVFLGWTGACSGNQLTCTAGVSGATQVGATFVPQYSLSISRSNSGAVTGTQGGNDKSINCGGDCSAKFTLGTVVTLTAVPAAGKSFINWTGSGAGDCNLSTSLSCNVTITGNTSIQANFSK